MIKLHQLVWNPWAFCSGTAWLCGAACASCSAQDQRGAKGRSSSALLSKLPISWRGSGTGMVGRRSNCSSFALAVQSPSSSAKALPVSLKRSLKYDMTILPLHISGVPARSSCTQMQMYIQKSQPFPQDPCIAFASATEGSQKSSWGRCGTSGRATTAPSTFSAHEAVPLKVRQRQTPNQPVAYQFEAGKKYLQSCC